MSHKNAMKLSNRIFLTLFIVFSTTASFAQNRLLAITIDDLPFVGESKNFHLNMIIDAVKNNDVPVTGFVIAGQVEPNNWEVLRKFRDAGLSIGNHSLTHANANQMSGQAYLHEIDESDRILSPILTEPKFFRFPYLAMGRGDKKDQILHQLAAKNYQVAPVTIDSKDFVFNQLLLSVQEKDRRRFLEVLKPCYLNFIWEQTLKAEEKNRLARKEQAPQILLIHSNLLNAYVLPDLIQLYRQNGFKFVSLDTALHSMGHHANSQVKKTVAKKIENFLAWD